jgi:hypothetical protein
MAYAGLRLLRPSLVVLRSSWSSLKGSNADTILGFESFHDFAVVLRYADLLEKVMNNV